MRAAPLSVGLNPRADWLLPVASTSVMTSQLLPEGPRAGGRGLGSWLLLCPFDRSQQMVHTRRDWLGQSLVEAYNADA